ncbi:MAG: hypothetical protein PHC70_03395 [Patescibacteria group bacterium]|nr:hypothetical protein [Patescibacteria group bacterium]
MFLFKKKECVNHGSFCQECGHEKWLSNLFGIRYCLHCRKNTVSDLRISIYETIKVRDSFRLRKKSAGFRKFVVEVIGGWFSSEQCKDGVELSRTLDKEKDEYHEIVKDYQTGKIVHENHEKLSDHVGHGSARH